MFKYLFILFLLIPNISLGQNNNAQENIQYVVLNRDFQKYDTPHRKSPKAKNKIEIIYFFYYGSPWSYKIDKELRAWAQSRPYPVLFTPAPVSFDNEGYGILAARVFFALQNMNEEKRLSPLLMEAIHKKTIDFSKMSSILNWLESHDIDKERFLKEINSAKTKSATLSMPLVMKKYQIKSAPTIVIDGEYVIQANKNMPPERLLNITKFMVEKLSEGGSRP